MVASSLFVTTLFTLALGKPMRSNLQLHEAREGIPAGFSLRGPASPDTMLKLRIALVQSNFAGLEEMLYDVSTPSSPDYGHHLSKGEVAQYIRPRSESVDAVDAWLAENGLTAETISPAGDWMAFEVPAGKANELFDADFSVFEHGESGLEAIRTLSYSIPADLKEHLDLVHPTITFPDPNKRRLPIFSFPAGTHRRAVGNLTDRGIPGSCSTTITPACLQAIYGLPVVPATQKSNKLAVSGYFGEYANEADLKAFLTQFRKDIPPSTTFILETIDGGVNPQDPSQAGSEANLDIQYTLGVATGVPIVFISVGADNHDGDLLGSLDLSHALLSQSDPPHVLTTSYGQNENTISRRLAHRQCGAYAQLGARGVSVLFASGDGGVGGLHPTVCHNFVPTFPSGCPFLTSVGATEGVNPETAAHFSSGGFSNYFRAPAYQARAVARYLSAPGFGDTYAGRFDPRGRAFPDVAALGVNFTIVVAGVAGTTDGTSCSSPAFAAVVALLNDRRGAAGRPPLGFLNPWLYGRVAEEGALRDVTEGTNPGCNTSGFPAAEGWDPITGLGTPNFAKLLAAAGL